MNIHFVAFRKKDYTEKDSWRLLDFIVYIKCLVVIKFWRSRDQWI